MSEDLFNMKATDDTLNVFDEKKKNQDGIYRPSLKDVTDKNKGYRAKVRFLPNVLDAKTGKMGPFAIERHIHYADFKNDPKLGGYYDCARHFSDKCPLCTQYWSLANSKNQADNERAKLISRTTKYYSYVMVLEDEQNQDLVGKIMIFPYGFTIKEKIKAQRDGEIGEACNVFDPAKGKDFQLIIKEKGGFPNYEASQFLEESPMKIWSEKQQKFGSTPVDENGNIVDPKVQQKVLKFLTTSDKKLEEFDATEWDEETKGKVEDIISILSGNELTSVERKASNTSNDMNEAIDTVDDFDEEEMDSDNFFMDDDDE
jgi:hypothetical protein